MRFPGFTDEWKKYELNQLVKRVTRKNKDEESKIALTISAQYGLVDQESFFNNKVASSDLSHYYLLLKGDYAYNKSYSSGYPWGAVKRLNLYEKGAVSTLYICFRPVDTVDSDYIGHYFESKKWHKGVSEIAVEGARNHGLLNVGVKDFFETVHFVPSIDEQKKISALLNLIDERISTQNKIIEDLKKLKSAIIERLFDKLEGKEYRYKELLQVVNERNKDLRFKKVIAASQEYGMVERETLNLKVQFDESSINTYKIIHAGDYVVHLRSFQGGFAFSELNGICSPAYIILRPNGEILSYGFLRYYFVSKIFVNSLRLVTYGIRDGRSINVEEWLDMSIRIPKKAIQEQILNTIQSIDNKLSNENQYMDSLLKQRRFLLSHMFI